LGPPHGSAPSDIPRIPVQQQGFIQEQDPVLDVFVLCIVHASCAYHSPIHQLRGTVGV
jgi:hypothetical protein